jgi:TolA-binding protein
MSLQWDCALAVSINYSESNKRVFSKLCKHTVIPHTLNDGFEEVNGAQQITIDSCKKSNIALQTAKISAHNTTVADTVQIQQLREKIKELNEKIKQLEQNEQLKEQNYEDVGSKRRKV